MPSKEYFNRQLLFAQKDLIACKLKERIGRAYGRKAIN